MRHIEYIIDEAFDGKKVIAYLRGQARLSSRLVNSLKRTENGITLNGEHIRTIDILKKGDVLAINIPEDTSTVEAADYPLDVIYEDEDVIVINKPAGLAMHPTHNHQGDTLANALAAYFNKKQKNVTFRAVGRLDKSTSGLVLCALNKMAAASLSGKYKKVYHALVEGEFSGCGTIDKPIYRPDPMKTLRAAGKTGDRAITHWEAVWTNGEISLLKIELETGRTHQIRVHFSSIGSSLCGDEMYGSTSKSVGRAALHCSELSFIHPVTQKNIVLNAPFPDDFKKIIM